MHRERCDVGRGMGTAQGYETQVELRLISAMFLESGFMHETCKRHKHNGQTRSSSCLHRKNNGKAVVAWHYCQIRYTRYSIAGMCNWAKFSFDFGLQRFWKYNKGAIIAAPHSPPNIQVRFTPPSKPISTCKSVKSCNVTRVIKVD